MIDNTFARRVDKNYNVTSLSSYDFMQRYENALKSKLRYKRCGDYIVTLKLLKSSITNESLGLPSTRYFERYRTNKCRVIDISHIIDGEKLHSIQSDYDGSFFYETGRIVQSDGFDSNLNIKAAAGIHYYMNKECVYGHGEIPKGFNGTTYKVSYRHVRIHPSTNTKINYLYIQLSTYKNGKLHSVKNTPSVTQYYFRKDFNPFHLVTEPTVESKVTPMKTPITTPSDISAVDQLLYIKRDELKDYTKILVNYTYHNDGSLHREKGPAVVNELMEFSRYGYQYYSYGKYHRKGKPAVKIWNSNKKVRIIKYYRNGKLHNSNGPAYCNFYDRDGKLHIEYRRHGKLHSYSLPASISRDWRYLYDDVTDYSYDYEFVYYIDGKKSRFYKPAQFTINTWKFHKKGGIVYSKDYLKSPKYYVANTDITSKKNSWFINANYLYDAEFKKLKSHEKNEVLLGNNIDERIIRYFIKNPYSPPSDITDI